MPGRSVGKSLCRCHPGSECLQCALHRKCRHWQRHDDRKGAPSALLAILAVTYADKSWFYVGRIAYFAAQAATLDLHFTPPAPRRPCLLKTRKIAVPAVPARRERP